MKQLFFIIFLLLFASQIIAQPAFNLGVKGGINSSIITEDSYEFSAESIVRMHVGAFARYGGTLFVQPEAYYSAKGGNMASRDGTDTKFNLNNLDIPVLFGVKLFKKKDINLRLMGGPVFCFVLSKNIDYESSLFSPFDVQNIQDYYSGFQYGASVDFKKIILGARFEKGMNTIYKPSGASYRTDGFTNSKNNTFMLTLGYRIL